MSRDNTDSLRARLDALEIGESYCIAQRLSQDDATSETIAETANKIHNSARALIARASVTGKKFSGEAGDWRTARGHHPVICFLITRTA